MTTVRFVSANGRNRVLRRRIRRARRGATSTALRLTNGVASLVGFKVIRANLLSDEWYAKLMHFARVLERVQGIEGDVVECGVGAGKSYALIAGLVRSSGKQRCVWGFDSWTTPSWEEVHTTDTDVVFSEATLAEVQLRLRQMDLDDFDRVRLVQGELRKTLSDVSGPIALAHIDCRLEESARFCLEELWPKLASGAVVVFGWFIPDSTERLNELLAELSDGAAQLQEDPAWYYRRYAVKP